MGQNEKHCFGVLGAKAEVTLFASYFQVELVGCQAECLLVLGLQRECHLILLHFLLESARWRPDNEFDLARDALCAECGRHVGASFFS